MEVTEITTDMHFGKRQSLTPQAHPELCVDNHIKLEIFTSETEFLQLQGVQGFELETAL